MTTSRDPKRPLRRGRKSHAEGRSEERRKPLLERFRAMLEGRRKAARRRRERARRERAAIEREKATARRQEASPPRRQSGRGRDRQRPAVTGREGSKRAEGASPGRRAGAPRAGRKPAARRRRVPSRAATLAAAKRARDATGTGARRARSRARPAANSLAARITAFGERCSRLLLAAAAPVLAVFVAVLEVGRKGLSWLAVALTPLRAVLVVTAAAALFLGVSQFVDYRGVAVGVQDYAAFSDVEPVAPAPQVDRRPAGEPHSYLLVPVAVVALALLVRCARGRWQLGRVVSLLGLGVIAVSVFVDAPAGLDEGSQAIAYASVEAQLVEGFYVQLVCGAVLVAGGLLVTHYARPARGGRASARRRRGAAVRPLDARAA